MLASFPSLRCSRRKKPVSCREAKGLVTELWSPRFGTYNTVIVSKIWITGYSLCSPLWHVTAANQWTIMNHCRHCRDWVSSNSGLEAGLPAFQLLMFAECDALPKGDLLDMLVKGNPCLLWNLSLHSLPEAWGSWERQHPPPVLHYACIIPIPTLQLKKKNSLMQSSKGFGHGVVVSKICYVQYSDCVQDLDYRIFIVLSVVTCDCCKPMNHNEPLSPLSRLSF